MIPIRVVWILTVFSVDESYTHQIPLLTLHSPIIFMFHI